MKVELKDYTVDTHEQWSKKGIRVYPKGDTSRAFSLNITEAMNLAEALVRVSRLSVLEDVTTILMGSNKVREAKEASVEALDRFADLAEELNEGK